MGYLSARCKGGDLTFFRIDHLRNGGQTAAGGLRISESVGFERAAKQDCLACGCFRDR